MKAQESGKTYDVMFGCSLRAPGTVTPAIADEFTRSFKLVHALPCDVQLGDHGAQYDMQGKYAKLRSGGRNPFIDPATASSKRTSRRPWSAPFSQSSSDRGPTGVIRATLIRER